MAFGYIRIRSATIFTANKNLGPFTLNGDSSRNETTAEVTAEAGAGARTGERTVMKHRVSEVKEFNLVIETTRIYLAAKHSLGWRCVLPQAIIPMFAITH